MPSIFHSVYLRSFGVSFREVVKIKEPMVLYAGSLLLGISVYWLLPFQPDWSQIAFCCALSVIILRLLSGTFAAIIGFYTVWAAIGLVAAHVETQRLNTPLMWADRMPWATISGDIAAIDYRADGERLFLTNIGVLDGSGLGWLNGHGLQLRLQGENRQSTYAVGQRVEGRVQLFPIGPPPVPGSLDLQFRAYFQGVSAYAATRGALQVVESHGTNAFNAQVQATRKTIRDRILGHLGLERGSILVAMSVGFPRGIPDEQLKNLRAAGLAHLLAISGLHMSLIVLSTFVFLRFLFAFIQSRFLSVLWDFPVKKISIIGALLLGLGYFFLSGQAVPVQRAFFMVSIFAFAILLDRKGVSLRTLALAVIVVLVFAPHVVIGPSFQMSFAAVSILILADSFIPRRRHTGLIWAIPNYAFGIALTSGIATIATATLTLFHFGQVSLVSVLVNILAVPIAGILVMPAALIAIMLMPFGLEGPVLSIAGLGIAMIQWIADAFSSWPLSVLSVGSWPRSVPLFFAIFLIVLLAFKEKGKVLALFPLLIMIALIVQHKPADMLLSPSLGVAVKGAVSPELDDFERSFMEKYWNQAMEKGSWKGLLSGPLSDIDGVDCMVQGCVLTPSSERPRILALTRQAVEQACAENMPIIAPMYIPRNCDTSGSLSDFDIKRDGPHAIWFRGDADSANQRMQIQSDLDRRGVRPWTNRSME